MAFPDTPLDAHVEFFVDGAWTDLTARVDLHGDERVEIQRGSRNGGSLEPAQFRFRLDNSDGALSTLNPEATYYGKLTINTPVRVRIGSDIRFIGEMPALSPRWNRLGLQAWLPVTAYGSLHRLLSEDPLDSAPRRYIPTTNPVAYWAMEGGKLVETAEAIVGGHDLRPFDGDHPDGNVTDSPEWGRGDLAPWLNPVVKRPGRSSRTILWAPVATSSGSWVVDRMYAGGSDGDVSSYIDVNPSYLGGSANWPQMAILPATHIVRVILNATTTDMYVPTLFNGLAHHLRWVCNQNGANADWSVVYDGTVIGSGTVNTYTIPTMFVVASVAGGATAADFAEGHLAIWDYATTPPVADAVSAAMGHVGETAGRRIERLCAEEQAPLGVVGDIDATLLMGPQYAGKTLVQLCQDAAAVDDGILYEPRQIARTIGDFEDGTVQDWAGFGTPTPTVANSTTRAHAGSRSMLVTWTSAALQVVQKSTPQVFVVGTTYTATAWVYVPTGGVDVVWALGGIGFGGATSLRDTWQQISITFVATATDHQTQLWPQLTPAGGELAWVDDIVIKTDERGLAFRTRESIENQTTVVALDYAQEHLTEPFEPEVDTRYLVNSATVSRIEGAAATYELTEGPLSVRRPPAGAGRYPTTLELPFNDDVQAMERAGWVVHRGTAEDPRYSSVTVDAHSNTSLIPSLSLVDVGDLMTITNTPDYLPPGTTELVVDGYTETFNDYEWTFNVEGSPGKPWHVGIVEDTTWGRLDTDASELAAALNSSATSFEVAVTDGPVWTVDDAEFPFSVTAGGEEWTVTDIAPALVTYGAAGTAAHADNASITPGLPTGHTQGQLLCLFAATRQGAPDAAALSALGYELMVDMGRAALFGKVHDGSETAPTVTFTGGAAGATNSAVMFSLNGRWHDPSYLVANSAWQSNASAQNVAYPDLGVYVRDCLVLYLVQKDDDWTGSTGPGTEIADTSSTLGNDQGIALYYQIQTTPQVIGMGSATITGGAAATSRAGVVAIRCDKQLWTVTRSVNGVVKSHAAGTDVRLTHPLILGLGGV